MTDPVSPVATDPLPAESTPAALPTVAPTPGPVVTVPQPLPPAAVPQAAPPAPLSPHAVPQPLPASSIPAVPQQTPPPAGSGQPVEELEIV